jgi:hypothetical protein
MSDNSESDTGLCSGKPIFSLTLDDILLELKGDSPIHLLVVETERFIYTTISIMGGYQGTLAGMWRIRSSCIWVLQKYPCATGVSLNRRHAYRSGSVTQRFLCIPVQSTTECTTRGKEPWHCPPKGEAEAHTRKPCHAKMSSRAPAKPCVRATFV